MWALVTDFSPAATYSQAQLVQVRAVLAHQSLEFLARVLFEVDS